MCHEPATPTIVSGYDLRLLGIKTEKVFKESGSVKRMGETMDGWDIPARRKLLVCEYNVLQCMCINVLKRPKLLKLLVGAFKISV